MKKPQVFASNDFKALRDLLAKKIFFSPSKPFEKKLILVPDLKLKNELMLHFINMTGLNVVMGIDFMQLGSGLQFLFKELTGGALHLPPLDLLTLHIESLLLELSEASEPLKGYLGEGSSKEKKAKNLAARLSKEFLSYGKYDLTEWLQKEGWQQKVWKEVFSKWDIPYQLLRAPLKKPESSLEVHLFKFSYLAPVYHQFFEKVSQFWDVRYYQFSPCCEFWTDILSERERLYVEGKGGTEVSAYLRERPPLLANLGKLARQSFQFFEESDFPLEEAYQSPSGKTQLESLQRGILHFESKMEAKKPDGSIVLHPASSKRREVEILYSTLVSLMDKEKLPPRDVRIYAPDIAVYAPYISLVFGAEESPFSFSIADLPKDQESSLLQTFLHLLSLSKKRFERSAVLKLFDSDAFKRRFALKEKDILSFTGWMEKGEVKWGVDPAHRTALLGGEEMLEEGEAGTWEGAFKRILRLFVQIPNERSYWDDPFLDFSDAELFGKCVFIIRSLRKDLDFLDQAKLTLFEWSRFLSDLFSRYFYIDEEEDPICRFMEEKFSLLSNLGERIPEALFSFPPLSRYLKNVFQERSGQKEAKAMEALRFSSLKLAAPDHAEIICLLGLDENAFPRAASKSALNEIDGDPLPQDEDRHIFLELFFAAKAHLILSYVNINEEDGKEQAPSSLIQELLTHLKTLKAAFHPPFPFHASYFQKGGALSNPSHSYFRAAKQFYEKKRNSTLLFPEFLFPTPLPQIGVVSLHVDLSDLSRFAKHPLRYYFNETLQIYLNGDSEDDEFNFSPLKKFLLSKEAHTRPFDLAFKEADRSGKLPLGRFKDIARLRALEDDAVLKESLEIFGIKEQPYTLDLRFNLELEERRAALVEGTLSGITSEGLLFHGGKKLPDLLKIWPLFLAFSCIDSHEKKQILLTKSGDILSFPKLEPKKALADYLLYYEMGLIVPSPCLPLWADSFLKQGADHLEKNIKRSSDLYAALAFSRPENYSAEAIYQNWAPYLKTLFQPLLEEL